MNMSNHYVYLEELFLELMLMDFRLYKNKRYTSFTQSLCTS